MPVRIATSTYRGLNADGLAPATWTAELYSENGTETVSGSFTTLKMLSFRGPFFGEMSPGFIRLRRPAWIDVTYDDPAGTLGFLRDPRLDELAYRLKLYTVVGGIDFEWRLRPQRGTRSWDPAPRLRTPTALSVRFYDRLGALESLQLADIDPTALAVGTMAHRLIAVLLEQAQRLPVQIAVNPWPSGEPRPEDTSDGVGDPDVFVPLVATGDIPTGTVAETLDRALRSFDAVCYQHHTSADGPMWVVEPRHLNGLGPSGRLYTPSSPVGSYVVSLEPGANDERTPTTWLDKGADAGGVLEAVQRVAVPTDASQLTIDPEFRHWDFVSGEWRYWNENGTIIQWRGDGSGAEIASGDSLTQRLVPVAADSDAFVRVVWRYDEGGYDEPIIRIILRGYSGTDYWLDSAGVWQTAEDDVGGGSLVGGSIFEGDVTADVGEGLPEAGDLWHEVHGPAAGTAGVIFSWAGLYDTGGGGGDPLTEFEVPVYPGGHGEAVTIGVIPEPTFDASPVVSWVTLDGIEHPRLALFALTAHAEARSDDALTLRAEIEGVIRPGTRVTVNLPSAESEEEATATFLVNGGEIMPHRGTTDCMLVEVINPAPPETEITLTGTAGDEEILWEWTQDPAADGYELEVGVVMGGPYTQLIDVPVGDLSDEFNPDYLHTGLTNGTTYYAVVRAYVD